MTKTIQNNKPLQKLDNKLFFSPKRILYFLIVVAVFSAGFLVKKNLDVNKFKKQIIPEAVKQVIGDPNAKFTVNSVKETSGVYEFELTIGEGSNGQKYTSYISKDGKILFVSGVKLERSNKKETTQTTTPQKLTCNDVNKASSPSLTAFVVADCPYGLQMQRVFKQSINELPALATKLAVRYIGSIVDNKITSMHGDKEATENLRQICIREEQKDKYWDYVSCYMKEGKTDQCLTQTGVDINGLQSCMSESDRGLKYAKQDFDLAEKLKVSASPTLVANNSQVVSEFDFGGRVPNAIKDILCCASQNKADFCNQTISKEAVATSFSVSDVAGTATQTTGGCGN